MADLIHPATGEPITLAPGEQLQRVCWHGPAAKPGTPLIGCRWNHGPKKAAIGAAAPSRATK